MRFVSRQTRRASVGALAAALTLALVAAACGGDDDDSAGANDTAAPAETAARTTGSGTTAGGSGSEDDYCTDERRGGTLTYGTGAPFASLDPIGVTGSGATGGEYIAPLYDTLMRYDAMTQEFHPQVAESLTPNDDMSVWTLKLRPGLTFGSGNPLTTADVKFSLERMATARVKGAAGAAAIQSMTIIDDLTMELDVGEPWGMFPFVLSSEPGMVVDSKLVQERGDAFATNPTGAGVGPYELARFAPGEEIVFRAKPDYWDGAPCIEELRFVHVPGAPASYDALTKGEVDAMFSMDIPVVHQAESDGNLYFAIPAGTSQYILADQGITGRADTPFKDVRIREAMQLAMDYDAINQRLFDGLGELSSAIVPESSPIYHGMEGPPYDPERARQLVEETVAEGVWDGHFTLLHATTPEGTEAAVLLEALWEAAGFDVTLEGVANSAQRVIFERNFEVATNGFAAMDPAPWTVMNGLESTSVRQRTGYANPDMDAALKQLRVASTIEETKEALRAVQEVWNETFPLITFVHNRWAIIAEDHVHGIWVGAEATPYFQKAWVES